MGKKKIIINKGKSGLIVEKENMMGSTSAEKIKIGAEKKGILKERLWESHLVILRCW